MSQWQRFLASPVDLDFHSPMCELFDFWDTDRTIMAEYGIDAIQMRRAGDLLVCYLTIHELLLLLRCNHLRAKWQHVLKIVPKNRSYILTEDFIATNRLPLFRCAT